MTNTKEPKVTECWTIGVEYPNKDHTTFEPDNYDRPAVLMWREDYDAIRKELGELREYKSFVSSKVGLRITEAYEGKGTGE